MSYGIYDCDILNGTPMFNLELMKLSSYYKSKGEIVAYSTRFHPERFTHFIIGKDRIDENFRLPVYEYNNIETIGRFFSPKKYYPMDLAIEKQIPDTYIYHKITNKYKLTRADQKFYISQLEGEHIRLSLNEKDIWDKYESQLYGYNVKHPISIYDYNPSKIENIIDVLKDLVSERDKILQRRLLFKFPIRVDSAEEIMQWLQFNYYQNRVVFLIERPPTTEDVDFITKNQEFFQNKNIICDISKNTTYDTFMKNINTTYRQIYFLRTILRSFSLIYDKGFFQSDTWENFITLLNGFSANYYAQTAKKRIPAPTLYRYVRQSIHKSNRAANLTAEETRNCFVAIAKENYELFKDFYEYQGEI